MNNSFIIRFKYWLDKKMAKGTISIIRILTLSVLVVVLVVSYIIVRLNFREGFLATMWDSLATIINAWVPSAEDGSTGYIVLNTVTAIFGLLFTSILFGAVNNLIEDKLDNIRKGNSVVLEKGHTVILGYNLGEHSFLKQLILASGRKKRCIVICTDIEKPDIEDNLREDVEIPRNIEVICRHGDITKINDLRCCSIETAKNVIVNAIDDNRRIEAILAVNALKREYQDCNVRVYACVSDLKKVLPKTILEQDNTYMVPTFLMMARQIAHSALDSGLSSVFTQLMNFEESEIYYEKDTRFIGRTIMEISGRMKNAIVIGIIIDDKVIMNPDPETVIGSDDELIVLEQSAGSYRMTDSYDSSDYVKREKKIKKEPGGKTVIFGGNDLLNTVVTELSGSTKDITIVSSPDNKYVTRCCSRYDYLKRESVYNHINDRNAMNRLVKDAEHIIMLANKEIDWEEADVNTILMMLKLIDLRDSYGYTYNIVAEFIKENSVNYIKRNVRDDYVVISKTASLLLAQMAENDTARDTFNYLLARKGQTLMSEKIEAYDLEYSKVYQFSELKKNVMSYGSVILGYSHDNKLILNPESSSKIEFSRDDYLIVIGNADA